MNLARLCSIGCLGLVLFACGDVVEEEVPADAMINPMVDAGGDPLPDSMVVNGCGPDNMICSDDSICVNDACESAFGRTYEFQVLLTMLETTDPNGDPWDINGGAPDPYVIVKINGTQVLRTDTLDNTFAGEFPNTSLEVIPAGASIQAIIYDADLDSDDEVYVCEANPVTAQQLRDGAIICAAGSLTDAPALMLGLTLN